METQARTRVTPEVMRVYAAMDRAIKTHGLYVGRGPLAAESLDTFLAAAEEYLAREPQLTLEVTPYGLAWEGHALQHGDKPSPFWFDLFKDGVREVTLTRGVTREELRTFFGILTVQAALREQAMTRDALNEAKDQDTVTRLWEAELQHVQYYAIDAYATGEVFDPRHGEMRRMEDAVREGLARWLPPEAARRKALRDLAQVKRPAGPSLRQPVPLEAPGDLPPASRKVGVDAAARDETVDEERFAVAWARLVRSTADPHEHGRLAALMVRALQAWLSEGHWDALVRSLRVLHALSGQSAARGVAQHVMRELARGPDLVRPRDHVPQADPQDVPKILMFMRPFGKQAHEALVTMLAGCPGGATLDAFEQGLAACGWDVVALHLARLASPQPDVAADAAVRLGPHRRQPEVGPRLRDAVSSPHARVRDAALRALEGDRDPATVRVMRQALVDAAPEVRGHAIRALGALGGDAAADGLLERVRSRDFRDLELGERRLLLGTLARVGEDAAWAWFEEELHRRTLFGGKRAKAWHQELVTALREVGSPRALQLLAGEEGP